MPIDVALVAEVERTIQRLYNQGQIDFKEYLMLMLHLNWAKFENKHALVGLQKILDEVEFQATDWSE